MQYIINLMYVLYTLFYYINLVGIAIGSILGIYMTHITKDKLVMITYFSRLAEYVKGAIIGVFIGIFCVDIIPLSIMFNLGTEFRKKYNLSYVFKKYNKKT